MMFRKTIIALFAVAAVGLVSPTIASARGGGGHGGGGGFHGGGGGGFHGGGGGFRGAGLGVGLGLGLAGAYGAYGYPYGYGYDSYAYDNGGCYLVRRRVMTPYGWRLRRVQVCD
jgi:hypothetical protein